MLPYILADHHQRQDIELKVLVLNQNSCSYRFIAKTTWALPDQRKSARNKVIDSCILLLVTSVFGNPPFHCLCLLDCYANRINSGEDQHISKVPR